MNNYYCPMCGKKIAVSEGAVVDFRQGLYTDITYVLCPHCKQVSGIEEHITAQVVECQFCGRLSIKTDTDNDVIVCPECDTEIDTD